MIFGPVRNGSVRFVFFKRLFFSNRTVYEPTYLVRNRFGPIFRKNIFIFANQLRTGQITYQISWFVIGSVQKISFLKTTIRFEYFDKYFQKFRNFEFCPGVDEKKKCYDEKIFKSSEINFLNYF